MIPKSMLKRRYVVMDLFIKAGTNQLSSFDFKLPSGIERIEGIAFNPSTSLASISDDLTSDQSSDSEPIGAISIQTNSGAEHPINIVVKDQSGLVGCKGHKGRFYNLEVDVKENLSIRGYYQDFGKNKTNTNPVVPKDYQLKIILSCLYNGNR